MIYDNIKKLVSYGLKTGLIEEHDKVYITNRLLDLFNLSEYINTDIEPTVSETNLQEILDEMTTYAYENNLISENSVVYKDLFDTKIMGTFVAPPSQIISKFNSCYNISPERATDYFYKLSKDSNYIRRNRILKDIKWQYATSYGKLDITINLSKPEKDPKAIAAAKSIPQFGYPKCMLCVENEGYSGNVNFPARQNHRIIPITINNTQWGFQYSPYVYYNEHCIVLNSKHVPMKIEKDTFVKLFDFVKMFPHYFVGSNADLPIVGGSILSHDHFQGGKHQFAMAVAPIEKEFAVNGYEDIKVGIVKWPMSVIRINGTDTNKLILLADHILKSWRNYSDKDSFIFAETGGIPHNTITPIARKRGNNFELDLVLRNNITTKENPFGVFHPHSELHNIKKENIGLIEVMGLAVLPSRLKLEMEQLAAAILEKKDINNIQSIKKHACWANSFLPLYSDINKTNIIGIIHSEIGKVFLQVLNDAGVYKRTPLGQKAFAKFINTLS